MKKKTSISTENILNAEILRDFDRLCRAYQLGPDAVLQQFARRASLRKFLFYNSRTTRAAGSIISLIMDEKKYVETDAERKERGIRHFREMIRVQESYSGDWQTKKQQLKIIELAWHKGNGLEHPKAVLVGDWIINISFGFRLLADFMGSSAEQLLQLFITILVEEEGDPGQPATAFLVALHAKLNHPHLN